MCNLYSVTTNQKAIRALFRVMNPYVGNLPPVSEPFPIIRCPQRRSRARDDDAMRDAADAVSSTHDCVIFVSAPSMRGQRLFSKSPIYLRVGHVMRMSYVLSFLLAAFSVPAAATDLKQEVERIGTIYAESFNRQDAEGIACLYASGGMHVNPAGPRPILQSSTKGRSKPDSIMRT
jgi:hypothetical protein